MYAIALILGLVVGFGIAVWLVGLAVDKSNNKGDSKAKFLHFSKEPLHVDLSMDKGNTEFKIRE